MFSGVRELTVKIIARRLGLDLCLKRSDVCLMEGVIYVNRN